MARRKTAARAWIRQAHRTKGSKHKRWEVVYEDPAQGFKRRTKGGFLSKRQAEEWRDSDECPVGLPAGTWADPAKGDVTFHEVAQRWLPTYVSRSGKARGKAQHAAIVNGQRSLLRRWDNVRVGDITPEAVALWVNSMAMTRAPSTVRHYFYTLGLVLRYAQQQGLIRRDPTQAIPLPAPRAPRAEQADRYALTWEQALKLAHALPEPWDMYVRLAAATGFRPEELAGLQLRDHDTTNQTLSVRRVVVKHNGEPHVEKVAKTTHSHRTIELDDQTAALLLAYTQRHRARAAKWFAAHPDHQHPGDALPLFVGVGDFQRGARQRKTGTDLDWLDYSKPLRHGWFYMRYWANARKAAGVPEGVRFYDLRHMHASLLVGTLGQPGALTLTEIAERLGHSTTVLLQRYAHSPRDRSEHRRNALNALATAQQPDNVVPFKRDA